MVIRRGTQGNDRLTGTANDDQLYGLGGADTLLGLSGNDRLVGGNGQDRLEGGTGRDALLGDAGNDTLLGGGGDDQLYGGHGDDRVWGGVGNDTLRGGPGADLLFGDQGPDTFHLEDGDRAWGGSEGDFLFLLSGGRVTARGEAGTDYFGVDKSGTVATLSGGADEDFFELRGEDGQAFAVTITDFAPDVDDLFVTTPEAPGKYDFLRFDRNGDGRLTAAGDGASQTLANGDSYSFSNTGLDLQLGQIELHLLNVDSLF